MILLYDILSPATKTVDDENQYLLCTTKSTPDEFPSVDSLKPWHKPGATNKPCFGLNEASYLHKPENSKRGLDA